MKLYETGSFRSFFILHVKVTKILDEEGKVKEAIYPRFICFLWWDDTRYPWGIPGVFRWWMLLRSKDQYLERYNLIYNILFSTLKNKNL